MKAFFPSAVLAVLVFIDQLTKSLAKTNLMNQADISILDGILSLSYHTNQGMAFGLFKGGRWFFLTFAVIVLMIVIYYYRRLGDDKISNLVKACLIVICAGAIGNSLDRLLNGYVVDFFRTDFINFPIFNVADIYVVVGSISLAVLYLFFSKELESDKNE